MNGRRGFYPATALLVALATPLAAEAPESWRWILVAPDAKGWSLRQGPAEVRIVGDRLHATLQEESPLPAFQLDGKVRGNRVELVERQPYTDAEPQRFTGVLAHDRSTRPDPANGWSSDRITVETPLQYLGLFRSFRQPLQPQAKLHSEVLPASRYRRLHPSLSRPSVTSPTPARRW